MILVFGMALKSQAQNSIAREWNEVLLDAIRNDQARPTVHARNLFHTSMAMYDAWAVFDESAEFYLLDNYKNGYYAAFDGFSNPSDLEAARHEAISYAVFRVLTYRFANSTGQPTTQIAFNEMMEDLGYDRFYTNMDYTNGDAAALGNFIGDAVIEFGKLDNSNEQDDYANLFYTPVNDALNPRGTSISLRDPNRWQPLEFEGGFVDQSGNPIPGGVPEFLSPEWGSVFPFALKSGDLVINGRNGDPYYVYHDQGAPPYLNQEELTEESQQYGWGFALVSVWSGHLDPTDEVLIDISPNSIGNNPELPENIADYPDFYDLINGGDQSRGYDLNPVTNEPYEEQLVPRGDYGRVLAEFWADGPDSETPPGHWFTILNYVNDHPMLEKRFKGEGDTLEDLEWDIKSYFALGGAMHDAAITAWGVKGWYDYIRPISAIRYMASNGQSTDPDLPNYHIEGIPLVDGYIELIETGDPLAGANDENVGKIKLYAWRGHGYILEQDLDIETEFAGVAWILAEEWWPYQRISFVTPPFAGYVSGHSTYSRAAAEVLTELTGDPFFPGGMGTFEAPQNEFLVFEEGPSENMELQWATYRDASDQCSLSRIWGGIHPPADDIPGRKMGIVIGQDAFALAEDYFNGTVLNVDIPESSSLDVYPNPIGNDRILRIKSVESQGRITIMNIQGQEIKNYTRTHNRDSGDVSINLSNLSKGVYILKVDQKSKKIIIR